MAARDADIKLLIGVATGAPDGDSEQLIRTQLNEIMSKIKVDVTLKTTNFRSQIRKGMSDATKNGKFSVSVSEIKIGANAIKDFKKQLGAVINTLTLDKGVSITIDSKQIGKATGEVKELKQQTEEAARKAAELKVRLRDLGRNNTKIGSGLNTIAGGANEAELVAILALQERYHALEVSLEELKISGVDGSSERISALEAEGASILENIELIKRQQKARAEDAAEAAKAEKATKTSFATVKSVNDAYNKVNSYIKKNPRISGANLDALKSIQEQLGAVVSRSADAKDGLSDIDKATLRNIMGEFSSLDVAITEAGQKGNTFFGLLSAAYKKFGGWMLVTKSLTTAWHAMGRMVENVRTLDAAMTELKKVTDETSATYAKFFDEASVRAKNLGATLADTITATADFARLGYNLSDAADLADAALVYKNVGDGIADVTEASESVISTMRAFGVEAKNAMSIVDKFNEVGNNFAISSQGIGEALRRSAAALAAGNNTLDESIALVTAANSVVQDADVVGTTMKTLSMYLRAAKTEAEEAGESTDGMANSVSELRSEILALTNNRVDIQIDDSTFKSTYQIMKELAAVWDDLTDISRANILEQIAGKRNANVVSSLLENFSIAEDAMHTAANSAGSALAENEKYLDSINGKVAQFQAAFEKLSASFVSSGLIKSVVDGGTSILTILTAIVDKLGAFPALLTTITTAVTAFSGMKGNYLGLFNAANGKIGVSEGASQWLSTTKAIVEYNKTLQDSARDQSAFTKYLDLTDDSFKDYLSTLGKSRASLSGYKNYCKQAGIEAKALGASSKLATVGVTALNVALNAIISIGVGLAIQGIVTAITHLINADKEAIEKTKELNAAFNEFKQSNTDNINRLESFRQEFESLSTGVSRYGENISLTSDQYDRYKQIVQEIVGLSPSLSEGYSIENGYLADKNGLLERAIELQKQEYQAKIHEMADTGNMAERMKGYAVDYNDWQGQTFNSKINFSGAMLDMMNTDSRDDTVERILKILDIPDMETVMEAYKTDRGYYDWESFWTDYADDIAYNFDKIVASVDYSELGFKSLDDFNTMVQRARKEADDYLEVQAGIAKVSQDVANDLKLAAQDNSIYDSLSSEVKGVVSNFVDSFNPEDVFKKTFSGDWKPDEALIDNAKQRINDFVNKLTPEVQNAMTGLFDMKSLFDTGEINVDEFKSAVNAVLEDLKAAGFDDETIKYLNLSLETDMVDRQLEEVKKAIGGLGGEYDDVLGQMSAQELKFAYTIIAQDGSMSFDELQEKIEWMKYANADMVDVLDFSDMITGLDGAKEGLDSIISAMDRLNSGTALTKQELANLALQYPKLLEQSNLFVDGSIEGQRTLLNSVLEMNEAEYDAQLDAKIAELKATEQVINDQLDMEEEKANIIAEIKNMSVNGQVEQEAELVNKISELNDLQGQNFVTEQEGELKVNEQALNNKMGAEADYGEKAATNIWAPYGNTIKTAHTKGFGKALTATNNYGTKLSAKLRSIASAWGAIGNAIKDAVTGNWKGLSYYFSQASSVAGDTTIDAGGDVTVTFDGGQAYVGTESLDSWVSNQEKASKQRIAALEDFKRRTVNSYKNLEALRGLDLVGIYGSAGKGSSGSSGGSSSSSSKDSSDTGNDSESIEDKIKSVEEYIADIDAYYEAEKRLQAAQERAKSLEKKLKYTEDPAEKIQLSSELVNAYREEIAAERELMDLKRSTIASNIAALRNLGFQVEYNSEANQLYIKNLEHLNELSATSAGEYGSLQEATNALRKETENLIDVTEKLNDDNISAISSIEDLGYQIQDTKNEIVDAIEEVYKKQTDAYQKIIDKRKEMIASAKDEFDYEADIADKVKEIADLQTRIDQLALDNSRSAQAERLGLIQQLEEKQKELANTQRDHSVDEQTDALDKMASDYEADKDAELEVIRSTVNASEELWTAFYQTLLGQSVSIGDSIDAEIAGAWMRAAEAVREYSASVRGVDGVGTVVSNVPKYHDGGVVNEANIGKDEALAILQKGEVVLNDAKQESLYRIIDFQAELSKRLGVAIGTMQAPASPSLPISTMMQSATQDIVSSGAQSFVFEPRIEVNITHNGSMADSDAKDYGEKIAGVAIDKLYSAFERRGISSTRGSRLKP